MSQSLALLWTLLLELPIVLAAGWHWRIVWWRALLAGGLASGLSHPVAWQLALASSDEVYRWSWYAIEFGVWAFEAVILAWVMRLTPTRAAALSLAANACSALAGKFLL